jgi:ribonucleoside-diphosphate reductase alpha chain
MRSRPGGGTFHIEDVQDQVELGLMRGGHHEWPAPMCCTANAARKSAPQAVHPSAQGARCCMYIDGGQRVALDLHRLLQA